MEPLNQTVSTLADRPRFETAVLSFFAFTGLMLAVIGLYGLLAFMTSRRTQEIGVRMALGATKTDILGLIARDGLRMVLAAERSGSVSPWQPPVCSRVFYSRSTSMIPSPSLRFPCFCVSWSWWRF